MASYSCSFHAILSWIREEERRGASTEETRTAIAKSKISVNDRPLGSSRPARSAAAAGPTRHRGGHQYSQSAGAELPKSVKSFCTCNTHALPSCTSQHSNCQGPELHLETSAPASRTHRCFSIPRTAYNLSDVSRTLFSLISASRNQLARPGPHVHIINAHTTLSQQTIFSVVTGDRVELRIRLAHQCEVLLKYCFM